MRHAVDSTRAGCDVRARPSSLSRTDAGWSQRARRLDKRSNLAKLQLLAASQVSRTKFGAVAQLGERCNRTAEVTGSIPVSSIKWVPETGTAFARCVICPPPFGRTESSNDGRCGTTRRVSAPVVVLDAPAHAGRWRGASSQGRRPRLHRAGQRAGGVALIAQACRGGPDPRF